MANALEEISREHLECAICYEPFQNPRLLPCLHSFCNDCLLNYLKGTATQIECPTCRQLYDVSDRDLTKFPINFPLRNLVDAICDKQTSLVSEDHSKGVQSCTILGNSTKLGTATCDSCGQTVAVVANCTDCKQGLCQFCKEAHLRVLAFKGHDVVGVSNLRKTLTSHHESLQQKCTRHPEEAARYFCLGCRAMLCSDCAVTEHRSSEHDVVTLKEATQKCREFLRMKADGILAIADEIDKNNEDSSGHQQTTSPGKGDAIEKTRRARNAYQVVKRALEQSSDDVSDFLVLFDTLDMMLQQICEEFSDAGYLLEETQSDTAGARENNSTSVPPLMAALQALSLTAASIDQTHLPPFFRRHWRHHHPRPPPPHQGSPGNPPPGPHHPWSRLHWPPGCHRPPWFAGTEGQHHPHPWGHPHRGRGRGGRGRGRGPGHCHARRK